MEAYRISANRLTGIADQARRLGGVEGAVTPARIQEVLEGVVSRGGDYMTRHVVVQCDEPRSVVRVDSLPEAPKYYYSGVLLPRLPQEHLAGWPYCVIRDDPAKDCYDLIMSKLEWGHILVNETSSMLKIEHCDEGVQWYRFPKANMESGTEWVFYQTHMSAAQWDGWTRIPIWSNQNIVGEQGLFLSWSMPVAPEEV